MNVPKDVLETLLDLMISTAAPDELTKCISLAEKRLDTVRPAARNHEREVVYHHSIAALIGLRLLERNEDA